MGPVVAALRALYFDVVRGRRPEYRRWCHAVYADTAEHTKVSETAPSARAES